MPAFPNSPKTLELVHHEIAGYSLRNGPVDTSRESETFEQYKVIVKDAKDLTARKSKSPVNNIGISSLKSHYDRYNIPVSTE